MTAMTKDDVEAWLFDMRAKGLIVYDSDAAILLGVSPNTIVDMKRRGARGVTALACRGALLGLVPYSRRTRNTHRRRDLKKD